MTLSTPEALAIVAAVVLGTAVTRFLPFLLFPDNKPVPKVIEYLGRALPAAMMGLLVVYCLRNVSIVTAPHGLPELIALCVVAGLHIWKRNVLLSIGVGTVLYMVLVQMVFV
jgi:branched-subunit amino acid transport protein AzlD